MRKDPRVYLAQILECTERIVKYVAGGKEAFLAEQLVQDAVIRNFEIIGEAARRVPEEYRQAHPAIPWRGLAAFRNVLIHQYEGVDLHEVWRLIEHELPSLREAVARVLPPLEKLERELAGEEE
ncbi:MAG: DUF86 domain-containing protein [Candidatus Methylomirabilales bacterium]